MQVINDNLEKTNDQKQNKKEYTQMTNMNEPQIFFYCGKNVRTSWKDGELWWVLKDVCEVLGISNSRDIAARLEEDEKGVISIDTLGGRQKLTIINEYGLYKVILRSDKPEARKFQHWITHEVLPQIRKRGAYITREKAEELLNDPDVLIDMLNAIKKEREEKEQLQNKIDDDKPKVVFADAVSATKDTILIRDLAKILKGNGIEIGEKRLFELLRRGGFLIKKDGADFNSPTQKSMELGLFTLTENVIERISGEIILSKTSRVTGKGQRYFINYFLSKKGDVL
ncbi:antirepressor [Alphaproteobacteria bacterium]|nr:antirepressor [Alphaproteobacteria bacterium]